MRVLETLWIAGLGLAVGCADPGVAAVGTPNAGPCPAATEPIPAKLVNAAAFDEVRSSVVMVSVVGGPEPNQLRDFACPGANLSCPERTQLSASITALALESQRCVRAWIETVGGSVDPTLPILDRANVLRAQLTFDQALRLTGHPHVQFVQPHVQVPPPARPGAVAVPD